MLTPAMRRWRDAFGRLYSCRRCGLTYRTITQLNSHAREDHNHD